MSLERGVGSVRVPNSKSFLVTEGERSMSGEARDFSNMETRAVIRSPSPTPTPPQGKAPKKIHAIVTETLGEHAPSYATVKNWVAHFKCRDFSTYDAPRPGRPKTVTTPEIIDQIARANCGRPPDFV